MVDTETKTEFIGFSSTIKAEGREGSIPVFTQVRGKPITDKELAELRRFQEHAAEKVDAMMKTDYVFSNEDLNIDEESDQEMSEKMLWAFEQDEKTGDLRVFPMNNAKIIIHGKQEAEIFCRHIMRYFQ